MVKITDTQYQILKTLLFHESFTHIKEETGLSNGVIRDDLTSLQHYNMIEVYEGFKGKMGRKVQHFDNDHPEDFFYRATKAGMDAVKTKRDDS